MNKIDEALKIIFSFLAIVLVVLVFVFKQYGTPIKLALLVSLGLSIYFKIKEKKHN